MRRIGVTLLAALLLFSLGAASEPSDAIPEDRWVVDWGDRRCSLIRRAGDPSLPILALRTIPGTRRWDLRLVTSDWPGRVLSDPERLQLALEPAGRAVEGRVEVERTPSGRALAVYSLPETFLPEFSTSRSLRLERDGARLFEIPYPNPTPAITALRACEDEVMRQFGLDPAAFRAVRTPPIGNLARFFEPSDYPQAARRAGREGTVTMRITVDVSGRVAECTPIIGSGHRDLDEAACSAIVRRARLTPATGLDGNPIMAMLVASITFSASR